MRRCVALATFAALLCGCSSESSNDSSAANSNSAIEQAPAPDAGVADGDPAVDGTTATQSYTVADVDPESALDAYQTLALSSGWTTSNAPSASGATDFTMTMTKGTVTLLVTSAPAGNDGDTELSLEVTDNS